MKTMTNEQRAVELEEIQSEICDLVDRTKRLLQGTGIILQRAEAYWLGYLEGMTEEDRYNQTIVTTLKELRKEDDDD